MPPAVSVENFPLPPLSLEAEFPEDAHGAGIELVDSGVNTVELERSKRDLAYR